MFLNLPWWFWGIACLIVAGIYTVIYPRDKTGKRPAWRQLVLRWFHALVWVLLSLACFIRVFRNTTDLANVVGYLGLVCYAIFMVTLLVERTANRKTDDETD
jgi:drug/metabolite transporter (DMT)-like permease